MITFSQLTLFSLATIVLVFTPGPALIYVITRGIAQGRRTALVSVLGFGFGNVIHILCAIIGLSALLASSATLFTTVKYAGALYLVYLGIKMLRDQTDLTAITDQKDPDMKSIFWYSVLTNTLNPKVAIFFLAFFPQFIDTAQGHISLQILQLGFIFIILSLFGFGITAIGSGKIGGWLRQKPKTGNRITAIAGFVFIGLGIRLAWAK